MVAISATVLLALAASAFATPMKRSGNRGPIYSEKVKGCLTPLDESLADGTGLQMLPCEGSQWDTPLWKRFEYGQRDGGWKVWIQDTDHCVNDIDNGEVALGPCNTDASNFRQGFWIGTWKKDDGQGDKICWELNEENRLVLAPCIDRYGQAKQQFQVMGS